MSKEEDEDKALEGLSSSAKVDSALQAISPPLHEALALFGPDRVIWAAVLCLGHFGYFMLTPRCFIWLMASPTWYLLPAYSTMVAAMKPNEPRLRALWASYWVLILLYRLLERMLLGWISQTLMWMPMIKVCVALWLMCQSDDASHKGSVDKAQEKKDREAYRALDSAYRNHAKEDLENALMSNREGTSKERERRKRAVDEMRAKLKKDLEKTVARPRRYHAFLLVEPFLPSQAHSSGDTFTEDTKELRERARRIRKDKWLERMKTEDEVTERGSESWVKDAGNAMLNQYGDLDPSSLNDRHRRRLDLGQKFVHFMDVVLETQHPRGAEEQIDIAYGMHGTDKYGRRVNLQGSGVATHMPDDYDSKYRAHVDKLWGQYTPEEQEASRPSQLWQATRPTIRGHNYSLDDPVNK